MRVRGLVLLVAVLVPATAVDAEWARHKTDGSRRVVERSIPAFTAAAPAGHADVQIAGHSNLPGPVNQLRLTADLTGYELDPALVPVVENPEAMRRALGGIFAGTPAQKTARWGDILEAYPAAATILTLLRAPLTADGTATVKEIVGRIKARIGQPNQVLTQTEYDALAALAAQHNLGGLVP